MKRRCDELLSCFEGTEIWEKYKHSFSFRVKDCLSLANKIRRKALLPEDEKGRFISMDPEAIKKGAQIGKLVSHLEDDEGATDLAGVRILHLFKQDWLAIHKFIVTNVKINDKFEVIESTAYLSAHDLEEYKKSTEKPSIKNAFRAFGN